MFTVSTRHDSHRPPMFDPFFCSRKWGSVTGFLSKDFHSHRIHGTGVFTYISHRNQPNVGKYAIHGSSKIRNVWFRSTFQGVKSQRLIPQLLIGEIPGLTSQYQATKKKRRSTSREGFLGGFVMLLMRWLSMGYMGFPAGGWKYLGNVWDDKSPCIWI